MTNEKKDKIKDSIFIWCITLILAIITIITVILYNKDVTNINVSNDNNLNTALYDKAITMDTGGLSSRITNDNTSYVFGNEFVEGYSYFKIFNADTEWLNEFISQDNDFYDDFHPYIKFNFLYNLSYDDAQYIGDIKYSYWVTPTYMNNTTLVTNYINSNTPTSYYNFNITTNDYRNGDDVSWIVSIYYDLLPYYNKSTGKLQENFSPCIIIPIYVYSDANEMTLCLEGIDFTTYNTNLCIKYIDYYPTIPLLLSNEYSDLVNQNRDLLSQNEDLQWQLDMKNIDLVEAVQRQQTEYDRGYQNGINDTINTDISNNGFKVLFNSILSFPINFISQSFNFEFMGINVASIVLFLCSVGIVLFVIKRLWK